MGTLLDKLNKEVSVDSVTQAIKVAAKPDRYAVWTAKAVIEVLSNPSYRHLLPENVRDLQIQFLDAVIDSRKFAKKCEAERYREIVEKCLERVFPGMLAHFVLRKRKFEQVARGAIAEGVRQIVSFGAGYDTLLYRLACEHPEVTCIEIDLPSTQKPKVSMIRARPPNLKFVNLDLREPYLARVMTAQSFYDRAAVTLFLAEGSLHFLDDDDVDQIFSFIADHSAPASRFAFTYFERGVHGHGVFPEIGVLTDMVIRLWRIQFSWGMKTETAQAFLNDRYFGLTEICTAQELREGAPPPIPPCDRPVKGENFVLAELIYQG